MNFREVDRKLCLIQDSRFVLALDPEQKTKANAVLFFGYIDHTRGLTYEALGLVRWDGDDYELISDTHGIGLKVRADSLDEAQVQPIEDVLQHIYELMYYLYEEYVPVGDKKNTQYLDFIEDVANIMPAWSKILKHEIMLERQEPSRFWDDWDLYQDIGPALLQSKED